MSSSRQSPIEKHLEVVPFSDSGHRAFQNKHPPWQPGARGIFGGVAIGQSLRAAQLSVPNTFSAHSMHCSFIHAGSAGDCITYHVEPVRDGRSFCTRLVRAVQRDRPILLAVVSFTTISTGSRTGINAAPFLGHATAMPADVPLRDENALRSISPETPFVNKSVGVFNPAATAGHGPSQESQDKRIHQWIRAQGRLAAPAGDPLHLAALAFVSDSYFLAAVPHSHGIWRFAQPPVSEFYASSKDMAVSSRAHTAIRRPHLEHAGDCESDAGPRVAMMVSLDHTIYFHHSQDLRADEWILAEVQSSWAGAERGLVQQKMWAKDGTLLATCIQEVSPCGSCLPYSEC